MNLHSAVILLSDRLSVIITVSDDSFYVIVLILHKMCYFARTRGSRLVPKKKKDYLHGDFPVNVDLPVVCVIF